VADIGYQGAEAKAAILRKFALDEANGSSTWLPEPQKENSTPGS